MQGTPLQRVAQEFPGIWVAHGRGLVDLRKQLGGRRPPLLRARGPGGVGPLGPQWHREVPLRSEALAQERSGSLLKLSGGTDMQDRRW